MKSPDQNIKQNLSFFDRWARTYDQALCQFWMKRFHAPVFKELKLHKHAKIIDISCGTGELLKKIEGKAELYGIDISEEMLKAAKRKIPSATFQKADVHALPFEDDYFDYAISTEAFHHYYDQHKAVREIARITKLGGKIIIVDVNFFLKPVHWLFKKFEPGHVKINSKKELMAIFKQAGLKNICQKRSFLFAIMTVGEK